MIRNPRDSVLVPLYSDAAFDDSLSSVDVFNENRHSSDISLLRISDLLLCSKLHLNWTLTYSRYLCTKNITSLGICDEPEFLFSRRRL